MSNTAATPNGNCYRCGGTLYENLVHHCTTSGIAGSFTPVLPARDVADTNIYRVGDCRCVEHKRTFWLREPYFTVNPDCQECGGTGGIYLLNGKPYRDSAYEARLRALRASMNWWRQFKAHWWFARTFGPITFAQYEQCRRARKRELGEKFDPLQHGETMLRAVGASEEQIALARAKGLA